MTTPRQVARDASLVFCGAVFAQLSGAIIGARIALWVTRLAPTSTLGRLLLGTLLLDGGRLLGLLLVSWVLGSRVVSRPSITALALVGSAALLDAGLALLLDQLRATWGWPALLPRLVAAGLSTLLVLWVVRRARR